MTNVTHRFLLGAVLAFFITPLSSADAICGPAAQTISVKGTLTGTFYATDGTPTKVKCDLTVTRAASGSGIVRFDWFTCPGIDTYGPGVSMASAESYRVVKNTVPQKTCVISNQFVSAFQRMYFVTIGVVTTSDTAEPTGLLKEKGTLSFTRNDGVFTGKYTATYPKP